MEPTLLRNVQAARHLHADPATVRKWARQGCRFPGGVVVHLPSVQVGSERRFRASDLDAFREECGRARRGEPVAAPPPDPDLARRLAGKARVAAKLRGPVRAGR